MAIQITDGWMWFCVANGIMLLLAFIMSLQSRAFFTYDVSVRKFSIMDLEFPASAQELKNIIHGIFLLPADDVIKTKRALRGQLLVDFLFMPAAYGSVFIACMNISGKMVAFGQNTFAVLAWIQVIPWACDIIENIYLLRKIRPNVELSKPAVHKAYLVLEAVKWGIVSVGAVCAIYALLYFWLKGEYMIHSLRYLFVIIAEIILFVIATRVFLKKHKAD